MLDESSLTTATAMIVAGICSRTEVANGDIPDLIDRVHNALSRLDSSLTPMETPRGRRILVHPDSAALLKQEFHQDLTPAVPIDQSITADHVICLEDGKKLKMLKRYLLTRYNLTPAAYRERWGLRVDYPMVAPNYSQRRSELAKEGGLGQNKGK